MSGWKSSLKYILLFLSLCIVSFLAYDTKSNGSFQKSYTGTVLKQTGALPVVLQAWNKIELYSGRAFSWLSINGPIYWQTISAAIFPYLSLFWSKLAEVALYLWDLTAVIRVWITKTIPPILEAISDNYMPKLLTFLLQIWSQFQTNVALIWAFLLNTIFSAANWLQTNILTGSLAPENLQKLAVNAIESLQKYAGNAYHWVSSQVNALMN